MRKTSYKLMFLLLGVIFILSLILIFINTQNKDIGENVREIFLTIPKYEQSDILNNSQLIVEGVVIRNYKSKYKKSRNVVTNEVEKTITTDTLIKISNVLKGELKDDEIILRSDKGKIMNEVIYCSDYPDFEENERVLLFLNKDEFEKKANCWRLSHLAYSKFILEEGSIYYNLYSESQIDTVNIK